MPTYRNDSAITIRVLGQDVLPGETIISEYRILDSNFTLIDSSRVENTQFLKIDQGTGLPITMNDAHASVHNGIAFSAWNYGAITTGNSLYLELKTPSDYFIHLKKVELWATGAPILFNLIEAPTLTTGVTSFTPQKRNRNGLYSASLAIKTNPTTISGGTIIDAYEFGGGGIGSSAMASTRSTDDEIILKKDTTYLVKCTNNAATTVNISAWVYWYEEFK